jgi:hypothetical protein
MDVTKDGTSGTHIDSMMQIMVSDLSAKGVLIWCVVVLKNKKIYVFMTFA